MNKKAGISISLKFMIGLVIAIMVILVLLPISDKFILFGKEKEDPQQNFFNELNEKIKTTGINQETTQIFQLKENYLLVVFNNQDTEISLKNLVIYSGNKKDITTILKKPTECKICLCLCNTKDDNVLLEDDCLQPQDICVEHEKNIMNNTITFFLFKEGTRNLKIKKTFDKINIEYE